MSISKSAALCALTIAAMCGGGSAANAAYSFTATIKASGSGFSKPNPSIEPDRKNPVNRGSVTIAFTPTDDPAYFIGIINDFTYEARFGEAGFSISTITSGMQPYPVVYGGTCSAIAAAAGSYTYTDGCGKLDLSASFGGPPFASFSGDITSVLIEDGDTTGGLKAFYGVSLAAVPEPSTWALMLAGFGMVGYAMRRRKLAFA
jgi:hypothetical protein